MEDTMLRAILSLLISGVLAVAYSFAQPPDTLWTQTYGGDQGERCYSIQQTTDDGYILGGRTGSFGAISNDMYLVKIDSPGNLEWEQTYGGGEYEECRSVQQTSDGGYILGGNIEVNEGHDIYLVKTDSLGNLEWDQTFGGSSPEYCYSVQQTTDGGYILGGETFSFGAGDYDMYLVKTNSLGIMEWDATFGGSDCDRCNSVQKTIDGGYILGGDSWSFGAGNYDMYLVKTDSLGNQEWQQTYGGDGWDYCYSVQQTGDGGFILGGSTPSYGAGMRDMYLVKTDSLGNFVWQQTFGGSNIDYCFSVQQTVDGGYILGGWTKSFGACSQGSIYLVKTDYLGNQEWQQSFSRANQTVCYSVQQTADGGYILGGYVWESGINSDMYLMKLDAGGSSPQIEVTLTPENPPIVIPATGGSFNFNVIIANSYQVQLIFDAWIMATLPDNTQHGPLFGPFNFTFPGGGSLDRDRTQNVPANAPPGEYTYDAYAGVYPDIIWGSDSFPFEKLSTGDGPIVSDWDNWIRIHNEEAKSDPFLPSSFSLNSVYPNPFNPATTITFTLPVASLVKLDVFDISGRAVLVGTRYASSLINGWRDAGVHEVTFDGSTLPSGIYIYHLTAGEFTASGKMVLMK
ncbi:hypothetical protein CEE37_00050 [candidate division LCP-89 bacterium B3_LCP]|uniref:Secretion system C-terminal sorting domain-containing protein n=1 Tax=candidate division LCP-89 bacterium B3_LCP TaxID=2012998 RepID=A0A532V4H6_UNCL8|nr:MAG: hypothetical protein CEE37_00050 [candidate division LCP-89 bacterium B3_LCP]